MLDETETDHDTAEGQEGFMDIGAFFIADTQASIFVKPPDGALDVPSQESQSASVFGISSCDKRTDLAFEKFGPVGIGIVSPVSDDDIRFAAGPAAFAAYGRNGVDQGNQLGDVMPVGAGNGNGEGNALPVGEDVVLGAGFAPIRWIGARLSPPKTARTFDESTMARDQSIWSACCSLANRTSWIRRHTPRECHSARRRQHDMPQPQPISWGRNSHGMPVRSTKRIPVSACRLGMGGRPRVCGGLTGGRSGSMISHNSSGNTARAICSSLQPVPAVPDPLALCHIYRLHRHQTLVFVRGSKNKIVEARNHQHSAWLEEDNSKGRPGLAECAVPTWMLA